MQLFKELLAKVRPECSVSFIYIDMNCLDIAHIILYHGGILHCEDICHLFMRETKMICVEYAGFINKTVH